MSATIKVGPVRIGQICTIWPNICDISLNCMFEQHNSETPRTQEVSASYYLDSSGIRFSTRIKVKIKHVETNS